MQIHEAFGLSYASYLVIPDSLVDYERGRRRLAPGQPAR
jgi:hypothetical protein